MSHNVILYDPALPYAGAPPTAAALDALATHGTVVDAHNLAAALADPIDCLVLLHGPYFPKAAWPAILAHLRRGGGLIHLGGAPLHHPVYHQADQWIVEPRQTAYHQQLRILETLPIDPAPVATLRHNADVPLLADHEALFAIEPTWNLVLSLSSAPDLPLEGGSSGPIEGRITPLLIGRSADDRPVAAPVVLLEHTRGPFAGGRWIMANQIVGEQFWMDGAQAIGSWIEYCARGVTEISVQPDYAAYQPGERPTLTLHLQRLHRTDGSDQPWRLTLDVQRNGEEVWRDLIDLTVGSDPVIQQIHLPLDIQPGLYTITCRATSGNEVRVLHQGFWGVDYEFLQRGTPLRCDRDYFWKDDRPLPVVGMTYMDPDAGRKFLHLPNVANWQRDMAQMQRAGINVIRTGIWSGWHTIMFEDGHVNESILRAFDAFVLTAKQYKLDVTFTFFAFTPEAWGGSNPYLDPRSVAAQQRFIAAFVSRHAATTNVQWDLINEPTVFDPRRLWGGPRSTHDHHERSAWQAWLRERYESIQSLQACWNVTPDQIGDWSALAPPEPDAINFRSHGPGQPQASLQWLDYALFSMAMHNRWAAALTATIKRLAPDQLVTVGQDEGLAFQRPSPFFYAEAVDYTTVHSWWLLDQLVWDGVFTKTPHKPNLVQETGIMYQERADGVARRSEAELRNLLERKYAYAFATGAAGAIHWIWNTNVYLNSMNESHIGARRADGTEKPEADVSYDWGRFVAATRDLFVDRALEDVVVIFPYSNDLGHRRHAFDATTRLTRTLAYDLHTPFRALGEYQLESLEAQPPKLIIVPSAHNVSNEAFDQLIAHVERHGATLLWTGPISLDARWQRSDRADDLIGSLRLRNVQREEQLTVGDQPFPVSFSGNRTVELHSEIGDGGTDQATQLHETAIGRGRLIWCPLPIELNDHAAPLRAVYRRALDQAAVAAEITWIAGGDLLGVYGRKLQFRDGALWIFVSEYAHDAALAVADPRSELIYRFTLPSDRSVVFATDSTGAISAVYRGDAVQIETTQRGANVSV